MVIFIEFEKEYDAKLVAFQLAFTSLRKFEEKHPAVVMGETIQYPTSKEENEYAILLDLEDTAKRALEKIKKKYFGL